MASLPNGSPHRSPSPSSPWSPLSPRSFVGAVGSVAAGFSPTTYPVSSPPLSPYYSSVTPPGSPWPEPPLWWPGPYYSPKSTLDAPITPSSPPSPYYSPTSPINSPLSATSYGDYDPAADDLSISPDYTPPPSPIYNTPTSPADDRHYSMAFPPIAPPNYGPGGFIVGEHESPARGSPAPSYLHPTAPTLPIYDSRSAAPGCYCPGEFGGCAHTSASWEAGYSPVTPAPYYFPSNLSPAWGAAANPPMSPAYSPMSPGYSPVTPLYSPVTPPYSPVTLAYSPMSPGYSPVTPPYSPVTLAYPPALPIHGHSSYTPTAPGYAPGGFNNADWDEGAFPEYAVGMPASPEYCYCCSTRLEDCYCEETAAAAAAAAPYP